MMILNYESKKQMKECIGEPLRYTETSWFGNEYVSTGSFCGCNRPDDPEGRGTGKREFFATVWMEGGAIAKVK